MTLFSRAYLFSASVALPLGMLVWCILKKRGRAVSFILGALTFVVFQLLIRLPILQLVLQRTVWFTLLQLKSPVLYALFLGITAALFEEAGRWIMMKLFMKRRLEWADAAAFGMGHGGIEALLLVGIGFAAAVLSDSVAAASADLVWAGTERLSTMMMHIGWSVMVMESVRTKKLRWLLLAFAIHAATDAGAVILSYSGLPVAVLEIVLLALGAAHLVFAVSRRKVWKDSANALNVSCEEDVL